MALTDREREHADALLVFLRERFPETDWQIGNRDEYLAAVVYVETL